MIELLLLLTTVSPETKIAPKVEMRARENVVRYYYKLGGMRERTRVYKEINYPTGKKLVPIINGYVPDVTEVTHANGDKDMIELLERIVTDPVQYSPCINGGSAAVTRGIYLAIAMGYRDIHLHGADSSFDGVTHVNGSIVNESRTRIRCVGEWFETTPWLMAQAQEFEAIYKPMTEWMGIKITVHGTGLIPSMWRAMKHAANAT